jgi:hypothetical protein
MAVRERRVDIGRRLHNGGALDLLLLQTSLGAYLIVHKISTTQPGRLAILNKMPQGRLVT